jgi:hypothetical protein
MGLPPATAPAVLSGVADPVMACLLLMATDGVATERIEPTAKLNKARAKAGKEPLPGH